MTTKIMPYFSRLPQSRALPCSAGITVIRTGRREQWFYLPSMRKARRSSPAEDDENTLGTVLTVEEMTSWRPQHETYRLLGVQNFPGMFHLLMEQESYRGERCYVIEAFPKEKMRCGQNEHSGCAASDGCCLLQEVFDKSANC